MKPAGTVRIVYLLPLGVLIFALIGFALRSILVALTVAFALAYVLNPAVDYLHALRIKRSLGALLVLVTFLGVALFALLGGLPGLLREVLDASAEASTRVPIYIETIKERVGGILWDRFHVQIPSTLSDLGAKFGAELRNLIPNPSDVAGAFSRTMAIVVAALSSLIVPVFAYYLLIDFNDITRGFRTLIPRRIAPAIESLIIDIDKVIRRYVYDQAKKSAILALFFAVGFRLVGIRLAIPLGIMTGLLTFIPYVGVTAGTVLAILMALLSGSATYHLLGVLLVVVIVMIIDTFLITPAVIGARAPLKPLEVLLSMIGSVTLFGIVGVVFAVPMGAVVKTLLRRFGKTYLDSHFYHHIPSAEPPMDTARAAGSRDSVLSIPPPAGTPSIPPPPPTPSIPPPAATGSRISLPPPAANAIKKITDVFRKS